MHPIVFQKEIADVENQHPIFIVIRDREIFGGNDFGERIALQPLFKVRPFLLFPNAGTMPTSTCYPRIRSSS